MHQSLRTAGLVAAGFAAGVAASLSMVAAAQGSLKPLAVQELHRITEAFRVIQENAVREEPVEILVDGCIGGMVRGADPDSDYLNAETFRDLQATARAAQGGLGMELRMRGEFPVVVAPIEETPAERAGLKSGDVLLMIDDRPLAGVGLTETTRRLRGPVNSQVKLTLRRAEGDLPVEMTLTREQIRVRSVVAHRLDGGLAHLRVRQFSENTGRDFVDALNRLAKEAPIEGVVLDLRNNPGGLLQQAIGLSAMFLPRDARILTMQGRAANVQSEYTANPRDYSYGGGFDDYVARLPEALRKAPLAVLVNRGSAAGSEIVAGAFKDHKRATIIGEKTFGRGSIQTLIPMGLGKGALKITTAEWATPNGTVISRQGIAPDIAVEPGATPEDDRALARAIAQLRGR